MNPNDAMGCLRYILAILFLSLKDSICENRKKKYFTLKARFVLEKIKF